MTVIVGVAHAGVTWMGADSLMAGGDEAEESADPKIVRRRGWLLGLAGTWGLLPVLRRLDVSPPAGTAEDGATVADALRRAWGDRSGRDEVWVMAGSRGRVWVIQGGDWSAVRSSRGYAAIGTGEHYALGALAATRGMRMPPRRRIAVALRATESHCSSVGGRYRIARTPTK